MVGWLTPIALLGLAAVLGPVAVHLLTRRHADRVPFASLRFIRAARTAAVRLRMPSDLWLLLVRAAVMAGAAIALAQPVFVTAGRRAWWDARLSRAVVVDSSASMADGGQRAAEAAAAEAQGATHAMRIHADRLGDGLARAVDALTTAPASRREIVVISDFQSGSLTATDVAIVPAGVGLRFVKAGDPPGTSAFRGDAWFGAPGIEARVPQISGTPEATIVRIAPTDARSEGLRLSGAGADADALLRAVARAGAPAPSADRPLAFAFAPGAAGNPDLPRTERPSRMPGWMVRTIVGMQRDPVLAEAAREHRPQGRRAESSGIPVARAGSGTPVVLASQNGSELGFLIGAAPADFLAAATLRSALIAQGGNSVWGEHESAQIPAAQLAAWTRDPVPVSTTSWRDFRRGMRGDARWIWVAVLLLLAVETIARRRSPNRQPEAYADAA